MRRFNPLFYVLLLVLMVLTGCAASDSRQAPGEYVDDSVITTKVKAAFFNDPELKVMDINVETYRGEVQLSGFVSSRSVANRAVAVAREVGGVTSVTNKMQLRQAR